MTPSPIILPGPFPVFLCDIWHKIYFSYYVAVQRPPLEHRLYEDRMSVCLVSCSILSAENKAWNKTGTHTKYCSNEWEKKTIGTVCSTGWSQTNMTLFHRSIQTVPDAAAGSPPSLLSASANPTCQDPWQPLLLWKAFSALSDAGISSASELPAVVLTCCHLTIKHAACASSAQLCETTVYLFCGCLAYHF